MTESESHELYNGMQFPVGIMYYVFTCSLSNNYVLMYRTQSS